MNAFGEDSLLQGSRRLDRGMVHGVDNGVVVGWRFEYILFSGYYV